MSTDWAAHNLTVHNHHGGNLAATSRIRHVLITAITAGDIAPGARLKEIDLGQQLGVSRTPLREAMSALQSAGILSIFVVTVWQALKASKAVIKKNSILIFFIT